jgi:hypothetical protein
MSSSSSVPALARHWHADTSATAVFTTPTAPDDTWVHQTWLPFGCRSRTKQGRAHTRASASASPRRCALGSAGFPRRCRSGSSCGPAGHSLTDSAAPPWPYGHAPALLQRANGTFQSVRGKAVATVEKLVIACAVRCPTSQCQEGPPELLNCSLPHFRVSHLFSDYVISAK